MTIWATGWTPASPWACGERLIIVDIVGWQLYCHPGAMVQLLPQGPIAAMSRAIGAGRWEARCGPGQRRNFRHRQMPQQPVGLAAGRHLHGALRHERLHQRSRPAAARAAVRPADGRGRR